MRKSQSIVLDQDLHDVTYKEAEKGPKRVNQYVLGERLGEGSYGKVREAIDSNTLKRVAIKVIKRRTLKKLKNGEETLKNEIATMKLLRNHENVIKLIEVIYNDEKQKIYMVIEFCGAGSLQQLVESHPNSRLPLGDVHHFFRQLIFGLEYIHGQGAIHRDIKPSNLMITPDRVLKIADFGVSRKLDKFSNSDIVSQSHGSPAFQSPQIATGAKSFSGFKLDIWACGITLYNLVVGRYPFEDENVFKLYEKIAQGDYEMPDFVEDELKDLINGMLARDEDKRLSIAQIKEHVWFNTTRYDDEQSKQPQLVDRWRSASLLPYIAKAVGDITSQISGYNTDTEDSSQMFGTLRGSTNSNISLNITDSEMHDRKRSLSSPSLGNSASFLSTSRKSFTSNRGSIDHHLERPYHREDRGRCTIL